MAISRQHVFLIINGGIYHEQKIKTVFHRIAICSFVPHGSGTATAGITSSLKENFKTFGCSLRKCPGQLFACALNRTCRQTLNCNRQCQGENQQACHLACQLEMGKDSPAYGELVQCLGENQCLPKLPPNTDGQCPVTKDNVHKVHVLSSLDELEGTWLEVRGLNCGLPNSGWEGGYDALPCRASSWLYEEGAWWYHTSFCGPRDESDCSGKKPTYLIASPSLSDEEPGLMHVPYVNPPLKPQNERWYVLSKPHPDWLMYTYCGSTPAGEYAGLNIATRAQEPWIKGIPAEVEEAFRQAAADFNFSWDSTCPTDQSQCPAVTAYDDLIEFLRAE